MDLWNHLQNTPELSSFLTTTLPWALFGAGVLVLCTLGIVNIGAGLSIGIVLWIAALVIGSTAGYHDAKGKLEHIQDGVMTYVAEQTDLTPLEPVTVSGRTASLLASDADGGLYTVKLGWPSLDTGDATGNLPDGVNPIEMVVDKRGGNDPAPDADPSPKSSDTETSSREPATA